MTNKKVVKKVIKKKVVKFEKVQNEIDVSFIPNLKLIEIKTRRFVQIDIDLTTQKDNIHIPEFKEDDIKDAIVKMNIIVNQEDAHHINKEAIEKNIRQYAYLLKPIIPNVRRSSKRLNSKVTAELGPIDAVKVWLEKNDPKNKKKILEVAEEIIGG